MTSRAASAFSSRTVTLWWRPVVTNRQAEFIGLACRLAKERKIAHLARTSALHVFLHAGVSDDEFSVIQDIVADKLIEEIRDLSAEFRRFLVQLFQGIS